MADETPTSILTKGQREYLRGEKNPAQERTLRTRIRERVRAAVITDIPLLVSPAGADDRQLDPEEIFDPEQGNTVIRRELADALRSMVALAWRLADAAALDPEEIIESGVEQGQTSRAEYLLEWFHKHPKRLSIAELQLIHEKDLVDEAEWLTVRNKLLGLPTPQNLDEDELDEIVNMDDEVLDEYGTGVRDRE